MWVFEGVGGRMLQTALAHLKEDGRLLQVAPRDTALPRTRACPRATRARAQVGYISEYPHNPDRAAETAAHDLETSSLFWKAETIQRGKQTIYGNAWPKDFAAVAGCAGPDTRTSSDPVPSDLVSVGLRWRCASPARHRCRRPCVPGRCKQRVLDLHASGQLAALVDEKRTFAGLESVADAIEYMLSGEAVGKVVVRIGDP